MAPAELHELVNYEKTTSRKAIKIKEISITGNYISLKDLFTKSKIKIETGDEVYKMPIDDRFIAQIVKRIYDKEVKSSNTEVHEIDSSGSKTSWNKVNSFFDELKELRVYLHYNLVNDLENFVKKIIQEIEDLEIIFDTDKDIYGFVSNVYIESNQLEFRENFLRLCQEYDKRIDTTSSKVVKRNGRITEIFNYKLDTSYITLKCGLVYGKNNGYGSYYVSWLREFSESKSEISPFQTESKFNWQNNPRVVNTNQEYTLESFTKHVVDEGNYILKACNKIAENARDSKIDSSIIMDTFDNILSKVACAKASKDRVKQRYREYYIDIENRGERNSIWAISHTLCLTGTTEKAIPFSMRQLLIKAGSALMDDGFEKYENSYKKDGIRVEMRM